ncbi:hypothetical protein [Streptomyces sp. UH6]|uniref:hypothetical protein n=1 Tax=Streptomyces sp. UH6 TaxID=2748379 RepID=UPI0015D4E03D|nr:hypothetical protein [Streptomyces sp. UH6]NYV72861.1 hypothetical protein [Streptomyces sp. UH6]
MTAFVSAVTSVLPEGRAALDGMELVTEVTPEAPAWRLFLTRHSVAVTAAGCMVVLRVVLVRHVAVTGEPGQWLLPVFGAPLLLAAGRRERTSVGSGKIFSRDPRRIEVRYDPRHPDKLYAPQPALLYVVVGVVVTPMLAGLLALGLSLTLGQLVDTLTAG